MTFAESLSAVVGSTRYITLGTRALLTGTVDTLRAGVGNSVRGRTGIESRPQIEVEDRIALMDPQRLTRMRSAGRI